MRAERPPLLGWPSRWPPSATQVVAGPVEGGHLMGRSDGRSDGRRARMARRSQQGSLHFLSERNLRVLEL